MVQEHALSPHAQSADEGGRPDFCSCALFLVSLLDVLLHHLAASSAHEGKGGLPVFVIGFVHIQVSLSLVLCTYKVHAMVKIAIDR
eukprot:scaffold12276_cov80-Skeletonema_marinoi.AAC.1